MMIMLSWIFAVASGCRPIACMAPLPMPPSPIPEPMAAMPMPIGSPIPSAAWKSIASSLGLVGVSRFRLVSVLFVREHEEEVDGAENREHERLERAGEQRQEQERKVERDPEGKRGRRQERYSERREGDQQHVLAEDVAEES